MALDGAALSGPPRMSPMAAPSPFVVGPSPSRAALAAADTESRQRSKDYAKRMQHEVLKKTTLSVIDALLAKHNRLGYVRETSARDTLEDIRAEEAEIRGRIEDEKRRRAAQMEYLEGLAPEDVAGAVSRALDILARQPQWINEPFFHVRVDVRTGEETLLVPQRGDRSVFKAGGGGSLPRLWSATFLEAALRVRSLHVAAGLVRAGADCGPDVEDSPAFQDLLKEGGEAMRALVRKPSQGAAEAGPGAQSGSGAPAPPAKRVITV